MSEEVWRDIKGYEGIYQVSNMGNVKNIKFNRIIKPFTQGAGYLRVDLSKENTRIRSLVHRLVAKTFIPNPENKPEVNHIDEDKTNNRIDNLEWCTRKENLNHGTRSERFSKSKSKPIIAIDIANGEYNEYVSCKDCAIQLGLNAGNISSVLTGRIKQTGGYVFKYLDK